MLLSAHSIHLFMLDNFSQQLTYQVQMTEIGGENYVVITKFKMNHAQISKVSNGFSSFPLFFKFPIVQHNRR